MGLYADYVFPHLLDFAMSRRLLQQQRPAVLAEARGDVLEIGFGGRRSAPEVEALRCSIQSGSAKRVAQVLPPVCPSSAQLDAARLPFDSHRFDCVVSTWTLCSIDRVECLARDPPRA